MGFFSKLFSNDNESFNEVKVDREVMDSFLYYANKSFPHEFLALLEGKVKDDVLYITGLIFLPGDTSDTGAVLHTSMLPPTMDYWGSIHSHPGPSAAPSGADLATFAKLGFYHMIVCLPYSIETAIAYDKKGNQVPLIVGDYSYLFSDIENDDDAFFDEDLVDDSDDEDYLLNDDEDINTEPQIFPGTPKIASNQIIISADDLKEGNVINIELDEKGNIKKVNNKSDFKRE